MVQSLQDSVRRETKDVTMICSARAGSPYLTEQRTHPCSGRCSVRCSVTSVNGPLGTLFFKKYAIGTGCSASYEQCQPRSNTGNKCRFLKIMGVFQKNYVAIEDLSLPARVQTQIS